ncbi:MAG: septum formation initiator family protein [Verrucomicrobia bacterium]|nr:septum formation initiator family protein [Verrucomicrobiota bacterium]
MLYSAPMKVTSIWDVLTKCVLFLLFIAAGVAIFFTYLPLIQQNQQMRRDIISLESEIRAEERHKKSLKAQADAILYDPRTVERLARERLGYARSNETVFYFESTRTP